jgi:formate hydrogenlyase subunit 4
MTIEPYILAILAMVAAPFVGALLSGLDRKVTARIQGRIGPPILQPFYDVLKLLGKEPLAVNRVQIFYAYMHLAFMLAVVALLVLGQDMLLILFVHAFGTIALIVGGMCVRSPYSRIGAQRKIMQMVAYEPILVLLVMGIYLVNGRSFLCGSVPSQPALLLSLPLVFVAFLMAVAIKLHKSPFDVSTSHHAHQELVKGVTLEYAGPYLAIIEIADFCEVAILFGVMAAFWASVPWVGLLLAAAGFFAEIILDNSFARLTTLWMVKHMWAIPTVLALGNVIWLYYR